jgi:hypothetical protein
MLPGITLHGHVSFTWLEGGASLCMHASIEEPEVPTGVAIFGRDQAANGYSMLYFDERGVSRIYAMTFAGGVWKYWRDEPGFSQRFTGTISAGGDTITGVGEMSKNGSPCEGDLELTYTRVK